MGGYGKTLPVTGLLAIGIGKGLHLTYPWIAAIGGALVITGFLLVRLLRPAKTPRG